MSETKWTPGPWTASPVSGIVGSLIVGETMADKVATAFPQGTPNRFDFELTQNNARLIAAAPELYTALANLSTAVEADWDDIRGYVLTRALAALAKARGEI